MRIEQLYEMAAKRLCDKCGKSMAANHYWYKGGWKCKKASIEQAAGGAAPQTSAAPTPQVTQAPKQKVIRGPHDLAVGDYVSFKYDIEQVGPIVAIRRDHYGPIFTVKATDGEYAAEDGGESYVDLRFEDMWFE